MNDTELFWIPFSTHNFTKVFQQQAAVMMPAGYKIVGTFNSTDAAGNSGVTIVFQK